NLIKQSLNGFISNVYDDFSKTRSIDKANDLFDKLEIDIIKSLDPTRFGFQYGPVPAISSFLHDMQALLLEVCRFPLIQAKSYIDKFMDIIDGLYYKLTKPDGDTDSSDAHSDAAI